VEECFLFSVVLDVDYGWIEDGADQKKESVKERIRWKSIKKNKVAA
jgi:hypothetical protein